MKILVIGDLHFRASDVGHCDDLIKFLIEESNKPEYGATIQMGDLFHDYGIVRADVLKMVWDFTNNLKNLHIVEGNHDIQADQTSSILYPFSESKKIYRNKTIVDLGGDAGTVAFVPFMRKQADFEKTCNELNGQVKTIFCHQEFNGAQFENGFYSKHGASVDCFDGKFYSGHIHMPYKFGDKVFYTGAAKWIGRSDTNQDRFCYAMDLVNGEIVNIEEIPLETHTSVYRAIEILEDGKIPDLNYKPSDQVYVDYKGNDPKVIKEIRKKFKRLVLRCTSPKKEELRTSKVSESKGFFFSLSEVIKNKELSVNKDILLNTINERLSM